MPDDPKAPAPPIPDVTETVEELKEQVDKNAEKNVIQDRTVEEVRQDLQEEMEKNRRAIADLQLKADILQGKYKATQPQPPLPPVTTAQEDLTIELRRKQAARLVQAQYVISIIVSCATVALSLYQGFTESKESFPAGLAGLQGAVTLFLFQKTVDAILNQTVPTPGMGAMSDRLREVEKKTSDQ